MVVIFVAIVGGLTPAYCDWLLFDDVSRRQVPATQLIQLCARKMRWLMVI